jgi:hypothetical protein
MRGRVVFPCLVGLLLASACAARKAGDHEPATEASPKPSQYPPPAQPGYGGAPTAGKKADDADATKATTSPPPPPPSAPPQASAPPSPDYAPAPPGNRAAALRQAATDIEASQRELDVAGGDCRNACRALQSMDRAAGRLCGLAQSDDEVRRCGDAKIRVYSARDKVRNTCGSCSEVSVDRNAPIPSR